MFPEVVSTVAGEPSKLPRSDVPRYYRVACRFHEDEKVRRWPDGIKLLALYLLTTKHRTLEGLFVIHPDYIAADLGWAKTRVLNGLKKLEEEGFLSFDRATFVLLIKNALRYQQPDSPNVLKGVISRLRNLPDSPELLREFIALESKHCMRSGLTATSHRFPEELKTAFGLDDMSQLLSQTKDLSRGGSNRYLNEV